MAWTEKYVDLDFVDPGTAASVDGSGAAGTWASNVLTPTTAPSWEVDALIGRTVTTSAGTFTITDNDATTLTVTAIGADPADGASGAWRIGVGSTADPWASYGGAISALGATMGAPTKVFVRGAQTLSAALAFSNDGTTAYPLLWVGCTGSGATWTPIGDDAGATKPTLSCDTYQVTISGDYQAFENIVFTGAVTTASGLVSVTIAAPAVVLFRCRFTNTAANSASRALTTSSAAAVVYGCFFSATTTAGACVLSAGSTSVFCGNHITGGDIGLQFQAVGIALFNIIDGVDANEGITSDSTLIAVGNTVCGAGRDGIRSSATAAMTFIANNLIHSATAVAINNSAGDSYGLRTFANMWYNCGTNGVTGNPEDMEFYNTGTASADPLPNLTEPANNANDFDLAVSQQRLAFPGAFEAGAYAFVGRMSHGAVQPLPDFPAVGNVQNDDTVDGAAGTLTLPAVEDVETGVTYGAGGTEFTGTLAAGGGGGGPLVGSSALISV